MKKTVLVSLFLMILLSAAVTVADAKVTPILQDQEPIITEPFSPPDTFFYGGTEIGGGAAEPAGAGWVNRKMWTWNPAGYGGTPHSGQNMDGWTGVDATADAEDHFHVQDNTTIGACTAANPSFSGKILFCGKTNAECIIQCYNNINGTGYGNRWNQIVVTPDEMYSGGSVVLSYDYANETEPGHDSTYVILVVDGSDYATLAAYDGMVSGSEMIALDPYLIASGGTSWYIKLQFRSDGGYSDEDGHFPTHCGAFGIDNYAISGAVSYSEDFEGVANGDLPPAWSKLLEGCGDFARAQHVDDLPAPMWIDPCVGLGFCHMADSVITLYDDNPPIPHYYHRACQDNYVESPVIDLSSHSGLPGRVLMCERLAMLPLDDHVFMYWMVQYRPGCESGGWSPWINDNYVYYTPDGQACFAPGCVPWNTDVSAYVPSQATHVRVALGVVNLCDEDPWGLGCSDKCNETPYYDNVTFGVFTGYADAPYLAMREIDYWQDQFPEDGTLNPVSTADTRTAIYHGNLNPSIFGDTLVVLSSEDNIEVHFVFRMANTGAMQPLTHPFFTTWFPGVELGTSWYQARMDVARMTDASGSATAAVEGHWMCSFHANDPTRVANALPEGTEILPNNLFVPGTRIEYFLKSCYPAFADSFYLPTGGQSAPEEFEVLPTMVDDGAGSVRWPCMIVADHFGQRGNWNERNSDRIERHMATLGYDYDLFNKLGPSSVLRNGLGRWAANIGQIGAPGTDEYNWGPGATLAQFVGYKHCILNAGNILDHCICEQDASMLTDWLIVLSGPVHLRTLWVSGDQICRELNTRVPWGPTFLNTVLCATYLHWSYSDDTYDFTYCLPMNGVVGNIWCPPKDYYVRANGCYRKFNEIGMSGTGGCNAAAEVEYDSQIPSKFAGISNVVAMASPNFKTYTEGYDFCVIRDDASLWPGSNNCGPDTFIATWMSCVLSWFGCATSQCGPGMVVDVMEDGGTTPAVTTTLSHAFPNPMNPIANIKFSVGIPGRVTLRVFDVSGRVVRTLVDEERGIGEHGAVWDGRNDRGEKAGSGVFFYQLEAPGYKSTKKIVILQ